MAEEMIRPKDAFKGCFFTGCLSVVVALFLAILFVFW